VLSKILTGAAALALATVLVTAGPASAQNCGCNAAYYPGYTYAPGYDYAPPYGYGAYDWLPWSYRGGPHLTSGADALGGIWLAQKLSRHKLPNSCEWPDLSACRRQNRADGC
jgi:hypothetical protein